MSDKIFSIKKNIQILYVLFIIELILLLLTVFVTDTNIIYQMTSSKRCWYYLLASVMSISNIILLYISKNIKTKLTILDILLFLFVMCSVIIYDHISNIAPHFLAITTLLLPVYLYIKQGIKLSRRMPDMIELLLGIVLIYIIYWFKTIIRF